MTSFILKTTDIKFVEEDTFENFISQFQKHVTDKILCVINGTSLTFYEKEGSYPKNIRYDYKQKKNGLVEYYFRDISDNNLYCVFGRENALLLYPQIDSSDPSGSNEILKKREEIIIRSKPQEITIIDRGIKMSFPNVDYPVEVKTYEIE